MSARRGPTPGQIRRRRAIGLGIACIVIAGLVYLALGATVLAPVDRHGARLVHLELDSRDAGRRLGVNVIVPEHTGQRGRRWLLVFLHGRSGNESSSNDDAFASLPALRGGRAPLIAFPDGGEHGYWHDRAEADWGTYVMDEVIPTVTRRFGIDPHRIAIGGISMGGFGALDIALENPGRFCAVGGHSPALWFEGSETAPGAFDDAADFERNDVVGTVRADPNAFGEIPVWIDYGESDDFRPYDEGFVAAVEAGEADFTHHSWPGGHEGSYWAAHWPQYLRFYTNALAHC